MRKRPVAEKKSKRKLRPAQTIREKSQAANEVKSPKPKKRSILARKIAAPFKKTSAYLSRYKSFKLLSKVLKFIGRIIVPTYIRGSFAEIKLVSWPSRRETRRLTLAVIGFAVVFGVVVASLDYGFGRLFKIIILGNHH